MAAPTLPTLNFYPNRNPKLRLFALWYFTTLIAVWTVAGHLVLGFEQAYAHPVAGVLTAIAVQALLEKLDSWCTRRAPRYAGGWANTVNFLPPAIIVGLASAMLTYANEAVWPVVFAASASIGSKVVFRAPVSPGVSQHVFNPSNFGITVTLLLLPRVGLAPPYQFTENVTGVWHWIVPALILATGIGVHALFTGRLPLVLGWLAGFAMQGLVRSFVFDIPLLVPFVPVTSAAFILFTLYMIPDPATTPIGRRAQVMYGMAIAVVYGTLLVAHVVYGLFLALFTMSAARGVSMYLRASAAPAASRVMVGAPRTARVAGD
jgi:hypothetical protein